MSFWNEKEPKELLQKLPFYNTFIEKPRIKHLKDKDLVHELPFYDELSTKKISKAFKRYARSYRIEVIDSKDPSLQLIASKSNIKDFFEDLLNRLKALNIK